MSFFIDFLRVLSRAFSNLKFSVPALLCFLLSTHLVAITIASRDSKVPLSLLIQRQVAALKNHPDSYWTRRGLARTYALAATWKLTSTDMVRAGGYFGETEALLWCSQCAHVPYRVATETTHTFRWNEPEEDWLVEGTATDKSVRYHRDQAIHHYREALRLGLENHARLKEGETEWSRFTVTGYDVDKTELGLAWNLLQTGREEDSEEAKVRLQDIIRRQEEAREQGHSAFFSPFKRDNDLLGPLISEAVDYLLPLLDESEETERERLSLLHDKLGHRSYSETPLAIDLRGGPNESLVDRTAEVRFDLDLTRAQTWTWPQPGVAWLVWDPNLEGGITDGRFLFGNRTFSLVHPDGYAALCMLDSDGDSWLRGPELEGLALWQDGVEGGRRADGRASREEMLSLASVGIAGLSCERSKIEDAGVHSVIRAGVERAVADEQGERVETLPLWDIVLQRAGLITERDLCPREHVEQRLGLSAEQADLDSEE